jgi:S-adenosyl methyltransferase
MAESQSLAQDPDPEADLEALNIHVPHPARVYDYWLGGKDNISQELLDVPYSTQTETIQPCHVSYSKTALSSVRGVFGTYMGVMSGFLGSRS